MKFANLVGYSDVSPFEVIRVISEKTIEIREMNVAADPSFVLEFHKGGFVAHCSNQDEQKWIYSSNTERPVVRARLQKSGKWKSMYGTHSASDQPMYFYDYNF